MRHIAMVAFLLLCACVGVRDRAATNVYTVAIHRVNVVEVETGMIVPDQTVFLAGPVIQSVQPSAGVSIRVGTKVIDGRGKFLIPGLWDMHVHLFRHSPRSSAADTSFPLFVANGVTGVRDLFTNMEDLPILQDLRRQVDQGRPGPWVASAGPLVDGEKPRWVGSIVAATPQQGRAAVREIKASGGDFVKVYSRLSRDTYFAIADEARRQNISFEGHVPDAVRAFEASDAGQKAIEHTQNLERDCSRTGRDLEGWSAIQKRGRMAFARQTLDEYDPKRCFALFEQIARNRTWMTLDPVLVRASIVRDRKWRESANLKYIPGWIKESWASEVAAPPSPNSDEAELVERYARTKASIAAGLLAAGAPLLSGTDVGNPYLVPGFSLHENLELLVAASGFSPLAALQTATINSARFLGFTSTAGSIYPGKRADLVLLDANPLANISNTRGIRAVILNGRHFDRRALDSMLGEAEKIAAQSTKPGK